jgi:MFS family permease
MVPLGILIALLSRWSGRLADKIGPRTPLIIGPMLTAVGFFLFSVHGLTAGPRDFWTTFFPAIAVVGVGMGITVAPLTTTVMNAVPPESTGIASGINNTIARTAGVLAIAIMGSLALITFENNLTSRIKHISLGQDSWSEVRQEMTKLAEATPPASASLAQKKELKSTIKLAFIDVFNQSALIATILAGLSVFITYFFIRKKEVS